MTTILSKLCCHTLTSTYADFYSPFSQKNIQECRCGTESCRGVLGPKPKKPPVEERSIASSIIAGTKRKFQDIMGSVRAKSEDNPSSPKKRKLYAGNLGTAKTKNASAESEVARERAEREAAEHSRQIASRENRALKRSIPATTSGRARAKLLRNKLTSVKSTRITTVSFQRKVPKPGALRAVKHTLHSRAVPRSVKAVRKQTPSQPRPSTPTRSVYEEPSDLEDDNSPNITPASLRSASKKSKAPSPTASGQSNKSNPVQTKLTRTVSMGASKGQQRTAKVASKDNATIQAAEQGRSRNGIRK
jgi:palmitoyltransferase ZDHHC9/14/18